MRRAWWWVGAVLLLGCAQKRVGPPLPPVMVTSLSADFPVRDRGALDFTLQLPKGAPEVRTVSWELFLDDVRFATGIESTPSRNGDVLRVTTPLSSKHLSWREGEATLDVGLRGEVDVGTPGQGLMFRDRREVTVRGRPLWNSVE
ncbi:MAG: hypothetical protein U0228_24555 [Myxococcaceae bacterium]